MIANKKGSGSHLLTTRTQPFVNFLNIYILLFAHLVLILLLPSVGLCLFELSGSKAPFLAVFDAEIFFLSLVLPFSLFIQWAGDENALLIDDPRFSPAGVLAPKSKADLAFVMHSLSWLANNGTASIVCFPGIMYRGGAEQKIRKYLIDNNFVDCVIQLPGNLFFGTSIATCIMVLKKNKPDNSTLFIDASKECIKVTNNNKSNSNVVLPVFDYQIVTINSVFAIY